MRRERVLIGQDQSRSVERDDAEEEGTHREHVLLRGDAPLTNDLTVQLH